MWTHKFLHILVNWCKHIILANSWTLLQILKNSYNWQTLSWSPKSKSRLMTGFSLDQIFQPPQPSSHPGKVSKKQDTAIYPKQEVLVYIRRLWNMFWNKPTPKNHPLIVQKGQKPCTHWKQTNFSSWLCSISIFNFQF